MKICFLISYKLAFSNSENRLYLANAALQLGHRVSFGRVDSLSCYDGDIRASVIPVDKELTQAVTLAADAFIDASLADFDAVWVLNFDKRETCLDRIQLLYILAQKTRVINHPEALLFLHSKISQHAFAGMHYPETYTSADFHELWRVFQTGGDWIVKPAGECRGRDVFKLSQGDSNVRAILQMMTGNDGDRYCLLQRYVPQVLHGEKRVLLAGGKVIGQYSKKAGIDHRGNLHQEAEAGLCDLLPDEHVFCEQVGAFLLKKGVFFAGFDLAWPWLLEWNVLNPGGIGTIDRLGGGNLSQEAVKKVLSATSQFQSTTL